jgi:hypothetical protein
VAAIRHSISDDHPRRSAAVKIPHDMQPVTVNLSAGDYDEVTNETRRRSTVEGSQMTVSGIIEEKLLTGKSSK